jgi:hypothetical protein
MIHLASIVILGRVFRILPFDDRSDLSGEGENVPGERIAEPTARVEERCSDFRFTCSAAAVAVAMCSMVEPAEFPQLISKHEKKYHYTIKRLEF